MFYSIFIRSLDHHEASSSLVPLIARTSFPQKLVRGKQHAFEKYLNHFYTCLPNCGIMLSFYRCQFVHRKISASIFGPKLKLKTSKMDHNRISNPKTNVETHLRSQGPFKRPLGRFAPPRSSVHPPLPEKLETRRAFKKGHNEGRN